ncbi:MAG: hypothetical protein ABIG32_01850 [Candidatus Uhrbacteria bacterium]|nr:hypothetical protein [Patescibacteria group bacterium]MBU1906802.1 hypothetical protein [Patescibacteria group bacterium]
MTEPLSDINRANRIIAPHALTLVVGTLITCAIAWIINQPGCATVEEEPEPDLTAIATEDLPLQIKDHMSVTGADIDIRVPTLVPIKSGEDCLINGGHLEVAEEISVLAVRLEYTPPETETNANPPPNLCTCEQEIMMTWRDLFLLSTINAD